MLRASWLKFITIGQSAAGLLPRILGPQTGLRYTAAVNMHTHSRALPHRIAMIPIAFLAVRPGAGRRPRRPGSRAAVSARGPGALRVEDSPGARRALLPVPRRRSRAHLRRIGAGGCRRGPGRGRQRRRRRARRAGRQPADRRHPLRRTHQDAARRPAAGRGRRRLRALGGPRRGRPAGVRHPGRGRPVRQRRRLRLRSRPRALGVPADGPPRAAGRRRRGLGAQRSSTGSYWAGSRRKG